MKVTYTPAGDVKQVWDFKPALLRVAQAEMIESRSGLRYEQWVEAVFAGAAKARRVLLWHLLTLTHGAAIRVEDVDFAVGELEIERDLAEARAFRVEIENWRGDLEVQRQGLAEIDAEIERLAAEQVDGPKATSSDDSAPTASPSPDISI
jgi:hypothetical protein